MPGTRIVYDVLCEFLHPNVGDLFATTMEVRSLTDRDGTRLLHRVIGRGPKDFSGFHELDHILAMCCQHLGAVLGTIPEIHAELGEYQGQNYNQHSKVHSPRTEEEQGNLLTLRSLSLLLGKAYSVLLRYVRSGRSRLQTGRRGTMSNENPGLRRAPTTPFFAARQETRP